MPRYFFDLHDDIHLIDEVGMDLPDLAAAKEAATKALTEAASDILPTDGSAKSMLIAVRDETGARVLEVRLDYEVEPPVT